MTKQDYINMREFLEGKGYELRQSPFDSYRKSIKFEGCSLYFSAYDIRAIYIKGLEHYLQTELGSKHWRELFHEESTKRIFGDDYAALERAMQWIEQLEAEAKSAG